MHYFIFFEIMKNTVKKNKKNLIKKTEIFLN